MSKISYHVSSIGFPSIERVLDNKSALSSLPCILNDKIALLGNTISLTKPEQLKWYRCEPAESAMVFQSNFYSRGLDLRHHLANLRISS